MKRYAEFSPPNTLDLRQSQPVRAASVWPKRFIWLLLGLALVAALIWGALQFWQIVSNPVPASIRRAAGFNIYYPLSSKLPAGYKLDSSSFKSSDSAVLYRISGGGGQLVVSEQKKPGDDQIALFYKNYMPLHNDVQLSIGKAAIGVIGQQTVVSIPTDNDSWILITAPRDINQDTLKTILNSLKT